MSSIEHPHGDGHRVGADFHAESSDYLAKRTLKGALRAGCCWRVSV